METLLLTHPACGLHLVPAGHPERPERLQAALDAFGAGELADVARREAPRAGLDDLERVHSRAMVEEIFARIPAEGLESIDADTSLSPQSGEAALRGAGAAMAGVDAVMSGEAGHVFCAVRPPGHHAEPQRAMGFCLFNHVAVAARHARAKHGLERIAVVDFDVHHGNGTQAAFAADAGLFYASSHEMPLYPGTGARAETGVNGNIVNEPLAAGAGGEAFRAAFEGRILPELERFGAQLLLVSAGFDAHASDPLANLQLQAEDYAWVAARLAECARQHGSGLVSVLEGGYDLEALQASVAAYARTLLREQ